MRKYIYILKPLLSMGVKGKRVRIWRLSLSLLLLRPTTTNLSLPWTTTYALETVVCITNDFEHEVTNQVYNYML